MGCEMGHGMSDNGKFAMLCAHKEARKLCGKVATHHEYGMDRCDEHQSDLDPSTWPR